MSRGQEKAIWDRFRAACDRFFTRRHADLAERKAVWAREPREEGSALREGRSARRVDRLGRGRGGDQAAAGRVEDDRPGQEDAARKRSGSGSAARAITFFARYAQRHDIARGERVAAREAIVAELEALATSPVVSPPQSSVASRVAVASRTSRSRRVATQRRAARPGSARPKRAADRCAARWQQELARARRRSRTRRGARRALRRGVQPASSRDGRRSFGGTDLDPDANRKRMESLVQRMEELAKSLAGPAPGAAMQRCRRRHRLAAMLKEALAANTIGGKVDDDSRFRAAAEDVASGAGDLVAHRARAGRGAPRAARSLPARDPADLREGGRGRWAGWAGRPGGQQAAGSSSRTAGDSVQNPGPGPTLLTRPILSATADLLDLDQLHVEDEHAVRRALAFVGQLLAESRSASSRLRPSAARLRSIRG